MCKSRLKLRKAKIYPLEVRILPIYGQLGNYSTYLSQHYQNFFSKFEFLFADLGSMVSKSICKLRHKLKNNKKLPELTWS